MELTPMIGVGAGDVQHAVRAQVERIIRETKDDVLAQSKVLTGLLRERNLINDKEVAVLNQLAKAGHEAAAGEKSAKAAYFGSRDLYNALLANAGASPVALVIASSAVGSYSITQGAGGDAVIFKKSAGDWEQRGSKIGALVGLAVGGGVIGAGLGALIGGAVGHIADDCKK